MLRQLILLSGDIESEKVRTGTVRTFLIFIIMYGEHGRTVMEFHAEYEPYGKCIAHQGASPVAYKWQRNPCDGKELDCHPDIFENMECNHRDDSCAYICGEGIL